MNWSKAIILFKFPSRERPEKFREALNSILNNSNQPELIKFIISLDSNDPTLLQYHKVIDEVLATSKVMEYRVYEGESKSKIHAVNRDLENAKDFQVIVCMSDDMFVVEKGFDDTLRNDFATHFPDGDGFLHYNDGYQKENVCTWSVIGAKYFHRDGHIYDPNFTGLWCDVQATEMAHIRGKHKYMGDQKIICRHIHPKTSQPHPVTGQVAQMDKQYERDENMKRWGEDAIVLRVHREAFYDIPESERVNGFKYDLKEELIEREKQYRQVYGNEFQYIKPVVKMAEENTEAKTVVIDLSNIAESAEKTRKLSDKLLKKVEECKSLSEEINAIGMVKVTVDVKVEALK